MNNYTQNITWAHIDSNPRYMQVLHAICKAKAPLTRAEIVKKVWHVNLANKSKGWNCGPFTLLKRAGYITYDRLTKKWSPTDMGLFMSFKYRTVA